MRGRLLPWTCLVVLGCPEDAPPTAATDSEASGSGTTAAPACSDTRPCLYGQTCVNGVCVGELPCLTMPCCYWDPECFDTTGAPSCRTEADCLPSEACVDGQCTPPQSPVACDPAPVVEAGLALPEDLGGGEALAILPASGTTSARIVLGVDGGIRLAAVDDAAATFVELVGVADPGALVTGDMNGDGIADLVLADVATSALHVLVVDDAGAITPLPEVAGTSAARVAIGDLDGDGDSDVVAFDLAIDTLVWHAGDGSGALGPATALNEGDRPVERLATASLDRRGAASVVATVDGAVDVWSDPATAPGLLYEADGTGYLLVAADFDGDGTDDIAAGNTTTFSVWSSGTREARFVQLVQEPARRLAAGDVDGDGSRDIVVVSTSTLTIWHDVAGDGCVSTHEVPHAVGEVAVGDLDGDGAEEIVVTRALETTALAVVP